MQAGHEHADHEQAGHVQASPMSWPYLPAFPAMHEASAGRHLWNKQVPVAAAASAATAAAGTCRGSSCRAAATTHAAAKDDADAGAPPLFDTARVVAGRACCLGPALVKWGVGVGGERLGGGTRPLTMGCILTGGCSVFLAGGRLPQALACLATASSHCVQGSLLCGYMLQYTRH